MTPDKTPSPTDAEAWALWTSLPLTGSAIQSQGEFARAVLAKWGSPVVATKVSIPTHTMEQEFQNHYRRGFEAGKKAGSPVVAGEPGRYMDDRGYTVTKEWLDSDDATSDYRAAYTTPVYLTPQPTQAQAGAVPKYRMLEPGVDRIDAADEYLQDDAQTWEKDPGGVFVGSIYGGALRPARRVITSLIGITHKEGGQHAAD